jgi:acetyltransferase-like isoleucine patch superfamily enzyme
MRILPLLIFDVLFVFFAVVVYGTSAAIAIAAAERVWGAPLWTRGLAVVVGYFVFLHAFVLVVGIVKRIVQRPLEVGVCQVGLNKKYFNWGLNSIFQGLFTTAFFDRQVHLIFYLKYLYYRAMGMKLSFNCIIGTRVIIRQAELVELGSRVTLGEMSGLYGHLSPDGRTHLQGRIKVGDGALVGGYASVGPDVEIGASAVIGAQVMILPGVRVGSGAFVGARSYLGRGVSIPARARVLANSVVREGTIMGEGETWEGSPAVRVESRKKEVSRES